MSDTLVPRIRTPLLNAALREQISDAHLDAFGDAPTFARVRVLWCMLAMEHGAGADRTAPADGRAAWNVWCNNFGNRRGGVGDAGRYVMSADEHIDGQVVSVNGGWPAFSTPLAGMTSWMQLLANFPEAWRCSELGNMSAFAQHLKDHRYFTDELEHYLAGLLTWERIYQRTWP